MMESHPKPGTAHQATRHWPLVSGIAAIVLALALGALIYSRHNLPFSLDQAWMNEVLESRSAWLEVPSLVLNFIGGGWFATILVPVVTILTLVLLKRYWGAGFYAAAVALSALSVQILKAVFDRPRPEEILVASDAGSFPSGHVANVATIAVTLAILLGRTWVWYVGAIAVVVMALSRTYLGAHWVTDTIGGALLGVGMAVIVWAPCASRLIRERERLATTNSVPDSV
jgi:membrane-associated phospholipid phosphatase